ncbi:MarR family transcriptional regulator [Leucobacter viscericola]|uniref:MarR family transcriptional regulator n=1 Tax=Leucobacter viscericola TaxID=2714935 RepID=A0A6G7XE64_9MICO|nr:MarR family transcriptional regulator [Leucobacter viscericola]QIK62884.1 MarR family transcriptional regulator [Leucobacter viscericola]
MGTALESKFESGDDSPGFMLWRVTNQWQAVMRRSLKEFGITHVQFVLLASLTWSSEDSGITQAVLSQRTQTDPMMVSQVLRVLAEKELVRRDPNPNDGRAMLVQATPAGMAVARAANQAVEAADAEFFGTSASTPKPFLAHLTELDQSRQ